MQRDSLHEIKGSDLHVMREILNKYIIYENINVIERHSGLFVVTLNPIKLSGVLSMNLEYDKKKKIIRNLTLGQKEGLNNLKRSLPALFLNYSAFS